MAGAPDGLRKPSEMTRHNLRPFVHKFQTPLNRYLLDVNTNRVLRVDAATWEIVEEVGVLSKAELQQKYKDGCTTAEIARAYEGIVHAQEQSRLLLPLQAKLSPPPSAAELGRTLQSQRGRIALCVTDDCNFRCSCCINGGGYRLWRTHAQRNMDWEVAKLAMDDYLGHSQDLVASKRCVGFYGGEPLLNFDLIRRCITYLREAVGDNIVFEVSTNGSLLEGEVADYLAAEEVSLLVSLNGPAHVHDYHRTYPDGKGTWEKVTQNIREFMREHPGYSTSRQRRPFLTVGTMMAPLLNLLDVEKFFCSDTSRVLGCAPYMMPSEMRSSESAYVESLAPADRRIPGLKTLYRRFLENAASGRMDSRPDDTQWMVQRHLFQKPFRNFLRRRLASGDAPHLDGRSRHEVMCVPGCANCLVTVEGEYYPCSRFPTREEFCIGNVRDGMNAAKSFELRNSFYTLGDEECSSCWCVNMCHAGCCAEARDGLRVSAAAKRDMCEQFRADTHEMLTDLFAVLERNPHAFQFLKSVR